MMKVQRMGGVVLAAAAVLLAAVVAVAAAELVPVTDKDLESEASLWSLYQRWLSVYNGSLDLVEKPSRFETFKKDARYVNEFNKREDVPYKLGLNQFSDLTEEEFDSGMYTGAMLPEDAGNVSLSSSTVDDDKLLASAAGKVPAKWDWRRHGAVTPVKNQRNCGACVCVYIYIVSMHVLAIYTCVYITFATHALIYKYVLYLNISTYNLTRELFHIYVYIC